MANKNSAEKLIALAIYSIAAALADAITPCLLALPLAAAAVYWRDLALVFKRLIFLNLFIALVVLSLVYSGQTHEAAVIFARSNLIFFVSLIFFAHSDAADLSIALSRLKMPAKIVSTLFFSVKIALLIRREFERFRRALLLRGWRLRADRQSYFLIANFVSVLFLRSIERSAKLEKTALLRGFDGKIPSLNAQKLSFAPLIFAVIALIAFVQTAPIF
ncbi:hypothetical protein FACS189487_03060 [Campylobacterota bacterium]|nr:hypothetical protein FACS189487_03060 [Campylobacterota bacterium]